MGRMKNAILAQEAIVQQEKQESDVLENELETNDEVKEAEMKIAPARVQRSAPPPSAGETEHAMASSKAHFADLETRLQREQQCANDAVKEADQLKLDLVLFQDKYVAGRLLPGRS